MSTFKAVVHLFYFKLYTWIIALIRRPLPLHMSSSFTSTLVRVCFSYYCVINLFIAILYMWMWAAAWICPISYLIDTQITEVVQMLSSPGSILYKIQIAVAVLTLKIRSTISFTVFYILLPEIIIWPRHAKKCAFGHMRTAKAQIRLRGSANRIIGYYTSRKHAYIILSPLNPIFI